MITSFSSLMVRVAETVIWVGFASPPVKNHSSYAVSAIFELQRSFIWQFCGGGGGGGGVQITDVSGINQCSTADFRRPNINTLTLWDNMCDGDRVDSA